MSANGFSEAPRERKPANGYAGRSPLGRLRGLLTRSRPPIDDNRAAEAERREFGERLEIEVERAKRSGGRFSLVVGELSDHVDAEQGSAPIADAVLPVALRVIAGEKRRIDSSARIGDRRFALILPETGDHGALVLTERLRKAIANAIDDDADIHFGIATFARHGRTADALMEAADRALLAVRILSREVTLTDPAELPATMVSVSNGDELDDGWLGAVLTLVETVDIRDRGNSGHSQTAARYAARIARELGFSASAAERVRLAGLLHDVGKLGVPGSVLEKPGPLDESEWELVRKHPEVGARLLQDRGLDDVRDWVLAHHERPDGQGYPRGLGAEAIPLEARIVAVADAYEAMTTDRPYRAALSHEHARAELLAFAGSQFDRRVVDAFVRTLEREGPSTRAHLAATG
jgi:diguanylate cyclase (GGDEF)-like protein/putative nucleotidyltransferase with HDIG domain